MTYQEAGRFAQLKYEEGFHAGYNQALRELNSRKLKTVVRCGECKHGTKSGLGQIQCMVYMGDDDIHEQDWFCAYGERS